LGLEKDEAVAFLGNGGKCFKDLEPLFLHLFFDQRVEFSLISDPKNFKSLPFLSFLQESSVFKALLLVDTNFKKLKFALTTQKHPALSTPKKVKIIGD
jgi:hypothetical protein